METANWGFRAQPADELVSITLEALPEGTDRYVTVHVQSSRRLALKLAHDLIEAALDAEANERAQQAIAKDLKGVLK